MNNFGIVQPPPVVLSPLEHLGVISISKEYDTRGHAPLKVLCTDGKLYVVKDAGPHVPPCILMSEFICHYLLRLWGLPTPTAAIINISPSYIRDYKNLSPGIISNRHQPNYYSKSCFGSRIIPNAIEVGPIQQTRRNSDWKHTINFYDLLLLTLFDIWVENDDRKPGNPNLLLRQIGKNKFRWYAIDHAFCFSTQNFDSLDARYVNSSYNDSLLYAPMLSSLRRLVHRVPNWSDVMRQAFNSRIQACQMQFEQLSNYVPKDLAFSDEMQTNISSFLFSESRNQMVLDDYFSRF